MSKVKLFTVATIALTLAACGSESLDGEITSSGGDAAASMTAWCDDDGAVVLDVTYGGPGNHEVVMVSPALGESGLMDSVETYSKNYSLHHRSEADLVVEVLPTDGTCHIEIVDEATGEKLERSFDEDADDFTLTATLTRAVDLG